MAKVALMNIENLLVRSCYITQGAQPGNDLEGWDGGKGRRLKREVMCVWLI